jgi:uncharacterized protein YqgC (DUF456 family)
MGLKEGMLLAAVGGVIGIVLGPPGILAGAFFGAAIGWSMKREG